VRHIFFEWIQLNSRGQYIPLKDKGVNQYLSE
jgi:hypothetical protein